MANINIIKTETGIVIENAFGKLELPWSDFYKLVKFSDRHDALNEIEEYITQFDDESSIKTFGKDVNSIVGDKDFMDKIAERLINNRISNETTDDIYNAIRELR